MWPSALLIACGSSLTLFLPTCYSTPAADAVQYVAREMVHAQHPLKSAVAAPSQLMCAFLCAAHQPEPRLPDSTLNCLKWSYDRDSRECWLWPLHSPDNPLTATNGSLYQRRFPPGYTLFEGHGVAYRAHKKKITPGPQALKLIEVCAEDDPYAIPAFPVTHEQILFIKTIPFPYVFQWLSINDIQEAGIYRDVFNRATVSLADVWPGWIGYANRRNACLMISPKSVYLSLCNDDSYPVACEYWL